ncbi:MULTISPECIES: hypothetical protein [Streptomyces]|nr:MULTISPECIES: hypothetical protein [Streptomyces]
MLREAAVEVDSLLLISKPYRERRLRGPGHIHGAYQRLLMP